MFVGPAKRLANDLSVGNEGALGSLLGAIMALYELQGHSDMF